MGTPTQPSLRHRIAESLRERVLSGHYEAGARLPSEPDLATSLGVSRGSLRAAIALLEADGVLQRLHGSGTYVTDLPLVRNDLSRNFGVSEMIAATGLKPGTTRTQAALSPLPRMSPRHSGSLQERRSASCTACGRPAAGRSSRAPTGASKRCSAPRSSRR